MIGEVAINNKYLHILATFISLAASLYIVSISYIREGKLYCEFFRGRTALVLVFLYKPISLLKHPLSLLKLLLHHLCIEIHQVLVLFIGQTATTANAFRAEPFHTCIH